MDVGKILDELKSERPQVEEAIRLTRTTCSGSCKVS
jgi:hypothetical protein